MRKAFGVPVAVISALVASVAAAKTVEEVLKEKGVITESEYKEVTASRLSAYVPGKGFTFTSPGRDFQLSLGGRGQFQYRFIDKDTGIRVRHVGAGTGAALKMAEGGQIDIVLAHAKSLEEKFVRGSAG